MCVCLLTFLLGSRKHLQTYALHLKIYESMKCNNLAHAVDSLAQHLNPPFRTQALIPPATRYVDYWQLAAESLYRNWSEGSCLAQHHVPSLSVACTQWLICIGLQMPGSLFMTENNSEGPSLLHSPSQDQPRTLLKLRLTNASQFTISFHQCSFSHDYRYCPRENSPLIDLHANLILKRFVFLGQTNFRYKHYFRGYSNHGINVNQYFLQTMSRNIQL